MRACTHRLTLFAHWLQRILHPARCKQDRKPVRLQKHRRHKAFLELP